MAKKLKLVPLPWLSREDTFPIDAELLYELIPVKQKMAALPLLKKAEKLIAVNGNNLIKYSDGTSGSHILDLLKYHLKVSGAERPRDYNLFAELIDEPLRDQDVESPKRKGKRKYETAESTGSGKHKKSMNKKEETIILKKAKNKH